MKESDVKFFRPLWIRILITAVVAVWCALEIALSHDELWIGITGVGVVYCVWNFFLRFPRDVPAAPAGETPPAKSPDQP